MRRNTNKDVEYLRLALVMAGVRVNYETCDLIKLLQERIDKLGGDFSIADSVDIEHKWSEKWKKIYERENSGKVSEQKS